MCRVHTVTVADPDGPDGDFQPNVVNTVVWLASGSSTLTNFAVNYAGSVMYAKICDFLKKIGVIVSPSASTLTHTFIFSYDRVSTHAKPRREQKSLPHPLVSVLHADSCSHRYASVHPLRLVVCCSKRF